MAKKTYDLVGWKNESTGNTPIDADNLEHMDKGIKYLYDEGATSKDIFICEDGQTVEDAPEEAKVVFKNTTTNSVMYIRNPDTNEWEEVLLPPTGDTLPVGSISAYGGENIPTNWLKCNGQAISRTDYSELFNAIGTTYGSGDGSTTFNLPNISERVIVGNNGDGEFSLGNTGGEKNHALTINEMPAHNHLYKASVGAGNAEGTLNMGDQTGGVISGEYGIAIQNAGGSQAHTNMQPYIALNYIIKAKQSVGVVGTVTSDINDTNDNAVPNAKTVKDYVEEVYSTDEVKTNKIWIDGKPIYRKVVSGTINATGNNQVILTGDIDSLIDYSGYINDPAENLKLIIGKSTYTDGGSSRIIQISNSIYMGYANNYHNLNFYAVVEYTKTTEEV